MPESFVGFVDAGFLRATGAAVLGRNPASVTINAASVVDRFRRIAEREFAGQAFLRAYWYDGAFDPSHSSYGGQRTFLNAIAQTSGVQLRLGHITEYPNRLETPIRSALRGVAADIGADPSALLAAFDRRWTFRPEREQKGVDTLIAPDLVRFASRSVYATAVLLAGDRDLAEAIRAAQDYGARVIVATPNRRNVAQEVSQLADGIIDIADADLRTMLLPRSARAT